MSKTVVRDKESLEDALQPQVILYLLQQFWTSSALLPLHNNDIISNFI